MPTSPSIRPTSTLASGRYRSGTRSTRPPCPSARCMTRGTSASKCRPATRRRPAWCRAGSCRLGVLGHLRGELRQVVDAEVLLDAGHQAYHLGELVGAELLVLQVREVLAEAGQFPRWDDLAEGGEYHGVLTGFVRLVHPVERLHRGRQPRPGARAGHAAGRGLAEQELGDHASPRVLG